MTNFPADGSVPLPTRQAVTVMETYGGKYGKRAMTALAAAQMLAPVYKWAKAKRKPESYTITVNGMDDIYPFVHEWVLERMPEEDQKALILDTYITYDGRRPRSNVAYYEDDKDSGAQIALRFDGSRVQEMTLEGHRIFVQVGRDEIPGGRDQIPPNWRRLTEKVIMTAPTMEARDAILRLFNELLVKAYPADKPPVMLMPSRWGGEWTPRTDLRPRSIDSVILKKGQLEGLLTDLSKFLDSEDVYERLGQNWHRGYLFYGEPGTGKTSVAKALASHFGLPIYYLPLGDIGNDANLLQLVASIKGRSVLLIEDIDVYHAAKSRDDQKDKSSLAAMLNALDGIWTPHGLITIMTTNDKGSLDPALIREGRVDVQEEFTPLSKGQVRRLAAYLDFECEPATFVGQSPASLIEAARNHHLG